LSPFLRQFTPPVLLPRLQDVLMGPGTGTARVLHLGVGNMYGGIETTLVTLARNRGLMPRIDLHAAVCFDGRLHDSLATTGLDISVLGAMRYRDPLSVWRARRRLATLLVELRPDIVISHSCWTQGLLGHVVRRFGARLVAWMHNPPSGSWIEWFASRVQPDLVIANSLYTAGNMRRLFAGAPVSVMYPICDIPDHPKCEPGRDAMRASLGCPPGRRVVLITARFDPYKGHTVLLEALARLRLPDWECWLAGVPQSPGEKAHEAGLRRRAQALGIAHRLRFLGHRTDVMALYAAADAFCQPNVEPEPFGHVFVEAQAMGCPVVTTGMGGALENVETGGRNRLVPRPDPALVAEALEEVLAGPGAA
jgi:glycosyltransferase involved in cell wall biosynthesis